MVRPIVAVRRQADAKANLSFRRAAFQGGPPAVSQNANRVAKVLVVDDDPDVRALLGVWLRGSEFQLIAGVDGYQAIQLARTQQPDIILLDINLPAAKGFVVHERLKRISSVATVPIVYISADRTAESQALKAGAAYFLAKPLEKESVLSTLRQLCHQSS